MAEIQAYNLLSLDHIGLEWGEQPKVWESHAHLSAGSARSATESALSQPSTSPEKGGSNSQNQRSGLGPKPPLALYMRIFHRYHNQTFHRVTSWTKSNPWLQEATDPRHTAITSLTDSPTNRA